MAYLSVVTPSYNRPAGIFLTLTKLTNSLIADEVEFVVSDDSDDEEAMLIREGIEKLQLPNVNYIRNPQRLGAISNWNKAVKLATTPYVLILHDDDQLKTEALPALIAEAKTGTGMPVWFSSELVGPNKTRKSGWKINSALAPIEAKRAVFLKQVRFSAVLLPVSLLRDHPFRSDFWYLADQECWLELFGRAGVAIRTLVLTEVSVAPDALTEQMWVPRTIELSRALFLANGFRRSFWGELIWLRWKYRFVLAGVIRSVQRREFALAFHRMRLAFQRSKRQAS